MSSCSTLFVGQSAVVGRTRGSGEVGWCVSIHRRTALTSSGPSNRKARGNARRRSARSRHPDAGCRCAPLPDVLPRSSGTTVEDDPSTTATTRSRSDFVARSRQPTHVRTGGTRLIRPQSTGWRALLANSDVGRGAPCGLHASTLVGGGLLGHGVGTRLQRSRTETARVLQTARDQMHTPRFQRPGCVGAAAATEAGGVAGVSAPVGSGASSDRMSMRQPVIRAARRAFWPSLPMARESW